MFKVPTQTPAGQYLLRIDEVNTGLEEHNEVYNSTSPAQIYPSCAQIEVVSRYDDALPEGILIPEALSHTSPGKIPCLRCIHPNVELTSEGMAITASMYGDKTIDESYVYPGGPLWDGESLVQDKPTVDGV